MKTSKRIAIILSVICLLSCFVFAACKSNNNNDPAKTVVLGFDSAFPPMGYTDDSGNYIGFDIDLAKETFSRLGYTLELRPIDWDSKDMELNNGTIDMIWNGFTIQGREDAYTWTTPYMSNKQVIVTKKDSDIDKIDDLKGKVVAVQTDSSGLDAVEKVEGLEASFKKFIKLDNYVSALQELQAGTVDAVVMDEIVAMYQIKQQPDKFEVGTEALASENYGVGFKLGNTQLRDEVQKTLEQMAKDGKMAEISNKWFGKDITTIGK
ncbi:MAG: amino acid ABC transporter substrate-binding protein [Clostridiales bacterium]|nr:amino acid ABC transporter substrate-binding protein [Clostridiales bacterium]